MWAVTTLAISADPMAPPIVRMLAFMPLATPVCAGGTAATIRFAMEEKATPKPAPMIVETRRAPIGRRARGRRAGSWPLRRGCRRSARSSSRIAARAGRRTAPGRRPPRSAAAGAGRTRSPRRRTRSRRGGVCRNWGRNAKAAYIETPNSSATRLVAHTASSASCACPSAGSGRATRPPPTARRGRRRRRAVPGPAANPSPTPAPG